MDPLSIPVDAQAFRPLPHVDLSRLRIGTTEDFGVCIVDPDIRRVFRKRVDAIRPMVSVCEPVDLQLGDADRAFDILRAEGFVAAFAEVYRTAPETLGPNVRSNVEMAAAITLADRAWAHLEQTHISRRFAQALQHYDVILAPVTPVSPFPWNQLYAERVDGQTMRNYYHWLALAYVVTLGTQPALSLPCGRDEHGMPFGLQVIGHLHGDARMLGAAHALEQAFASNPELVRPQPDMLKLQTPNESLKSIVTDPPQMALGGQGGAHNAV
jgi:Asp-tRNA(Asn)/Glu-tRNA(Gln) amidotransferase A subunit family amidase